MNRQLVYVALLGAVISACSSNNKRAADGGFDYVDMTEGKPLSMPSELNAPKQSDTYFVTDDINKSGPVGDEVDIRAPSLVLPIATSTRLDLNNQTAAVWFDQELDDEVLADFIEQIIKEMLAEKQAELIVVDAQKHIYESSWIETTKDESSIFSFSSKISTEREKYRYTFDVKPHGRSLLLHVELLDYDASFLKGELTSIDKHREEIAMLNNVIGHVDYKYRLKQREHRLMIANQKLLSIGENHKGEPTYFVELEKDLLWQNLPVFFGDYGFTVTDLDESKRIYYVTFEKPDIGLWDSLWGDEVPIVEIENAEYVFKLFDTEIEDKTALTIYREDGQPVPREVLERIFEVVEPGLSFRTAF